MAGKDCRMTLEDLQRIALRLGNQMFVRHYYWLNYPNDPQLMGIQFPQSIKPGPRARRTRTCACGTCDKCKHREYVRKYRVPITPSGRLAAELEALGFNYSDALGIWTVERTEGKAAAA